jgi:hypothetical protein
VGIDTCATARQRLIPVSGHSRVCRGGVAFRFATRAAEFTTVGAFPACPVRPRADPPLVGHLKYLAGHRPGQCAAVVDRLVLPRLNTAPMPLPASAVSVIMAIAATSDPSRTPFSS